MSNFKPSFLCLAFALSLVPFAAEAGPLTIVNVGAPAVNCVFNPSCTITVTDSIGNFTPPGDSGSARLQSRTYVGVAPTPGAGLGGYDYRVDLTSVQGAVAANCVKALSVDFGPVVPLPYSPKGKFDVFVVTSGGLGSVGLASAVQTGTKIVFTFSGGGVCPGATSYFFGLASKSTMPKPGKASLAYTLPSVPGSTADRVPGP